MLLLGVRMPREGMREYMLEDRADAAMAAEIVEPVKPLTGLARKPRVLKPKPPKIATEWQTGFALHQMKRDPEYRDIVIAPPGYTIVEFDAAGQEFRWMAIASGDETMLRLCQPGEDPHSFMGSRINSEFEYRELIDIVSDPRQPQYKAAKATRQSGKVGNLSLQYRTSAKTFYVRARVDHGMNLTMAEAEHTHFVYHRTYRNIRTYWGEAIAKAKQQGYAETLAGRRVQLNGDWGGPDKWGMGSTAINYVVQGTGADQKALALMTLTSYVSAVGAYFLFDLHDGLYWAVPDDRVTEFCVTGKHLLDNLPYTEAWGFTPPIPLTWDCKSGKSWGSLKGVN